MALKYVDVTVRLPEEMLEQMRYVENATGATVSEQLADLWTEAQL